MLPNQPVRFQKPRNPIPNGLGLHAEQLGRSRGKLVLGKEAVPGGEIIIQFKRNSRFHPPGVVSCHTQLNGEAVHRLEGGLQALVHEQVGIVI